MSPCLTVTPERVFGSSGPWYTLCKPSRLLPTLLALSSAVCAFDAALWMPCRFASIDAVCDANVLLAASSVLFAFAISARFAAMSCLAWPMSPCAASSSRFACAISCLA